MNGYLGYILLMAITTYLIRMIPITFFRKKLNHPWIKSFLYYIPYAVLTAMTIPAIFYACDNMLAAIVACGVALVSTYLGCDLIVVALLACLSVFIIGGLI